MPATESLPRVTPVHQGLERWDRWLQEKLAPSVVALNDWWGSSDGEYRWDVEVQVGYTSVLRIPASLIQLAPRDFERMTDGLSTYGWEAALHLAGPDGLTLVCQEES